MDYDKIAYLPPRESWVGDDNQYLAYVQSMSEREYNEKRSDVIRALKLESDDLDKYRFAGQNSVPSTEYTEWRRWWDGEWYYRLENPLHEPQFFPWDLFEQVLKKPWLYITYAEDMHKWVIIDDPKEKKEYEEDTLVDSAKWDAEYYIPMLYEYFDADAEGKYRLECPIDDCETRIVKSVWTEPKTEYCLHDRKGNSRWFPRWVLEKMESNNPCHIYYGCNPGRYGDIVKE